MLVGRRDMRAGLAAVMFTAVAGAGVAAAAPAAASGYGNISISGAVQASYTIAGTCFAHASVLTSVTLRTEPSNGTTLSIAGSTVPPPP